MKNTDYVIYMTTRGGRTWRYLKDKTGWKQVGPEGQTHQMTAEQALNHLLPALAGIKPVTVRVVYKRRRPKWCTRSGELSGRTRTRLVPTRSKRDDSVDR